MGVGGGITVAAGPRLRGVAALLALAAALSCGPPARAADPDATKLVVVIYPHESDGAPGIVLVNRGIRSTFAEQRPGRIEVRNEYVDTTRLGDADFMRAQVSLLRQKYAGRQVDLLIAGLSSGLDFALAVRGEAFPGVPVVSVLVEEREVKARRLPPDVIGVPVRMDLEGTLDLALRLHPHTRRVFVVAGSSPFDRRWEAEARQVFGRREGPVEFVYLSGLPMDELLGRVAVLPGHSLLYYLHVFRDGTGKGFIPAEVLDRLAAAANAPVYGHVDTFVERGAVGGHAYRHEDEGRAAARLGLRILSGERPETIAVQGMSENTYLFNGRQLRRWGISESSLPPGSVILHNEPTFWDAYKWHITGVVSLCAVEALLIAGLLVQRAKRRRAESAGRESEARFRVMADAAPVLIWASGADKRCTYFNRPWLEFTGRPLERELGDGWAEGVHLDDLARCLAVYASHFDAREPFEMMYRLRRYDGEYRWVLDRGVPRLGPSREFTGYVGACIDITERRRAEEGLRASRRELRLLTGRLIEAQEGERRRVARELHDDLSQGLALLAVEIDQFGQRPPASAAEARERVGRLAARVKELSSVVHDLSHQLHPSKLEQVGLVAAVRGLCRELGEHHGLQVRFAHHGAPEAIPEAAALCLYRVVQEALRNTLKHARTDRAEVELAGAPDGIRLRVSDGGAGFDPAAAGGEGGLGLVSMRERLHLVGGEITVTSRPGAGTRIDVRVPAPNTASPASARQAEPIGG